LTRSDWLNVLALTAGVCFSLSACRDDNDRVHPTKGDGKAAAFPPSGSAGAAASNGAATGAATGGQGTGPTDEGGSTNVNGGSTNVNGGSPDAAASAGQNGAPELGGAAGNESPASACYIEETYGDLGSPTGTAAAFKTNGGGILYTVTLNAGPPPDEFRLELYKGLGAFKGGLSTGVFSIAGDELDYGTCGVCPIIYENKDITKLYRGAYIATGGTVTLTSVSGNLIGDLKDVTMEHVTINSGDFHSTPVNDGCVTKIDSLSFSAVIE
jgi:hypothetical protein